jgi:ABC-type uncharacterized transport system auxiliary subunit
VKPIATLALVALAGCSALDTPGTSRPLYLVSPPPPPAAAPAADAPTLRVRTFAVDAGFAGFDLVWRKDGAWQHDAYHGWLSRPGDMLSDASIAWLANAGCFARVQREGLSLSTDRTLEASVSELAADLDTKPPTATIRMRFFLTGNGVDPLVVSAEASEPMKGPDARSAIDAWNAALAKCLVTFTEAVRARKPSATAAPAASTAPATTKPAP